MVEPRQEWPVEDLRKLLDYVTKHSYKARDGDTQNEALVNNCVTLFSKDYKYSILSNSNGELCSHYPSKIPLLEYETTSGKSNDSVESMYDMQKLRDLFNKAKFARCRARFPVPVILYEGKHICRGATISGGVEIYGRSGFDFLFSSSTGGAVSDEEEEAAAMVSSRSSGRGGSSEWQLFNRIRGQDIRLLKTFSVGYIVDLMVEKKKVKFGMNVTSSEKVDKEHRYSEFVILSVPYPGCEFFREWRENGYMAEGLLFDWTQGYVDAQLDLPADIFPPRLIDWTKYQKWDLVTLTQNYLQLLLHQVKEGDSGLLVHCISGWDRTPLFVSLLRLSLWADGVIHLSLGPVEILYLTIAYDWYLFGHDFPDRIGKGEEIFFFCFNFLKYITTEDYSMNKKRTRTRPVGRTDSECNMDGVLLDTDLQRASYRGSNTSISSGSSLNSTRSSIDNAPMYFSTNGTDTEDVTLPAGNGSVGVVSNSTPSHGPHSSRHSSKYNGEGTASHRALAACQCASTTPMAVPHSMHRVQENRANSPAYGSWQIISGTGSFRGSTSSPESPKSSAGEASPKNQTDIPEEMEESVRKQRLDAVRRIFLSVYSSLKDYKNGDSNSGITGLFDSFAEKVGIRMARATPV